MANRYGEREWETRKKRIDRQLAELGWKIVPVPPGGATPAWCAALDAHAVEELPTDDGPADYALFVDGVLVGILEAKRFGVDVTNVLTQAERYARAVALPTNFFRDGYRVPLIFASNGEQIFTRDLRRPMGTARAIARFRSPDAVRDLLEFDDASALERLRARPHAHPRLRPYQRDAVDAIEAAMAQQQRNLLLAMATGTGKTFVLVHQLYRLLSVGATRRVLFLVDRRALAVQAVRAFRSYEIRPGERFTDQFPVYSQRLQGGDFDDDEASEPFDPQVLPAQKLMEPSPSDPLVYVCTIQRMAVNLFGRGAVFNEDNGDDDALDDDDQRLPIPIHAFDLVIADECHRGYNAHDESIWRRTLDHFDAVRLGLTATPVPRTIAYFRHKVFSYGYEQAVADGYLVDYDVLAVHSGVLAKGAFLKEGEHVRVVNLATGEVRFEELEEERAFDTEQIERAITVTDTNRKVLIELKRFTDAFEAQHGRFPKTLVFACNDRPHLSHAEQIVGLAREVWGRGNEFVEKITGKVDRPLRRVREFRNRKDRPGIAVTVDLLTTGVDVPDLEVLVFLRFVRSRPLFVQMLGRGTRRSDNLPDKSHFTVVDCFGGTLVQYFAAATDMTSAAPDTPSKPVAEVIDAIWRNQDRDYHVRCLARRLRRVDQEMSGDARELFARFVPDGDLAILARALPQRVRTDFSALMKVLRDPEFQRLLVEYPRPVRHAIEAHQHIDDARSEWLVHGLDGKTYKPEDYLALFERYVRENPDEIDAIRILMERPRDWCIDALNELRARLRYQGPGFGEELLQRAHERRYRKPLVDIISMVKHAAREDAALLTAEERVARAFARVTEGRSFTPAQQRWLDRIRGHLAENLSIGRSDFEAMPAFGDYGGWDAANEVFAGELEAWIERLNEAVAA